ncbi:unnamed protein product [Caenorhabditis bovis]|uniref:OBG-type G domain-containing protein n=1 Tax=Caenorhabditis bovis TaxID=2654633 RepID=A0A8S1EPW1_9PELO|nr:unnamed protein product [Caenorhabditis bovis]
MRFSIILRESISSLQKLVKHDLNIVTVDKYTINVKAGNGGAGLARYNGVGGNGGDIYFVARPNIAFSDIKKRLNSKMKIRAEPGKSAQKTSLIGKHGAHTYFEVPVGVEVVDRTQNTLIARCNRAFRKSLIAKGGAGGSRETNYKGLKGENFDIEIHLKLRPNIGLLGFPNAGKSTLLKAFIPEKSVKIADYPFTTINPQLGFWNADPPSTIPFADKFTLSIADLPGIIEGASRNRGRGYQFLKHLEYADVIVMVVDSVGFQLKNEVDCPFRNPLETIALLNKEVECYDKKLAAKPVICVLNKIDLLNESQKKEIDNLREKLLNRTWTNDLEESMRPHVKMSFRDVVTVSAKSGKIDTLKAAMAKLHQYLHPLTDVDDESDDNVVKKRFL